MLRNLDVWTWKILIEQYNWRELKNKLLGWVKDSSQKTLKGKEVSRNHFKRQCSVNKPCVYQWGKSVVTVQMSILMPSSSSGQNFFILKMHHGNRYMTKTSTRVSFYHPLLLAIFPSSFDTYKCTTVYQILDFCGDAVMQVCNAQNKSIWYLC